MTDAEFADGIAKQVAIFDAAFAAWEAQAERTAELSRRLSAMEARSRKFRDR